VHCRQHCTDVVNSISFQRLILVRENCFGHASTLIVRFTNLLYSTRGCSDLAGFGISISFWEYIFHFSSCEVDGVYLLEYS